jgi:uncharacterized BrkB/YihY/UPF0761 family membrane protein
MIEGLKRYNSGIRKRLPRLYEWLNKATGGAVDVFGIAISQFSRCNASETAASLAFFGILSLFPLLAVLVSLLSLFATEGQIQRILVDTLLPYFRLLEA